MTHGPGPSVTEKFAKMNEKNIKKAILLTKSSFFEHSVVTIGLYNKAIKLIQKLYIII